MSLCTAHVIQESDTSTTLALCQWNTPPSGHRWNRHTSSAEPPSGKSPVRPAKSLAADNHPIMSMWMFPKIGGTSKSSHFNGVFHYTPSILGYQYFWKHPCQVPSISNMKQCISDSTWKSNTEHSRQSQGLTGGYVNSLNPMQLDKWIMRQPFGTNKPSTTFWNPRH